VGVGILVYQRAVEFYESGKKYGIVIGICNHLLLLDVHNVWAYNKKKELYKDETLVKGVRRILIQVGCTIHQ